MKGVFRADPFDARSGRGSGRPCIGISGSPARIRSELHASLSPYAFHDAAAALVVGGRIEFAIEEERLSRRQHTNAFPEQALSAAAEWYRDSGGSVGDLQLAYYFAQPSTDAMTLMLGANGGLSRTVAGSALIAAAASSVLGVPADGLNTSYHRHHDCHAAMAAYLAGFTDGLVIVMDGNGEDESISVYELSQSSQLKLLADYPVSASIGHLYRFITHFLGLGAFGEYKLMGLAAYSENIDHDLLDAMLLENGDRIIFADTMTLATLLLAHGYHPRSPGPDFSSADMCVAATVQHAAERVAISLTSRWLKDTGARNLSLVGGVALNGLANGRLAAELGSRLDRLFVPFAPNDCGAAIGAALLGTRTIRVDASGQPEFSEQAPSAQRASSDSRTPRRPWQRADAGPAALGTAIDEQELIRWAPVIVTERAVSAPEQIAQDIVDGLVVGWVRSRAEFGPRALGFRSILASPRDAGMRDRINARVKGREGFRPLAPAVRAEDAGTFFDLPDCEVCLDYMSIVVPVRPEFRDVIPAVVHVDGTARPQTVWRHNDTEFWTLLSALGDLCGVPVALNTSYNLAGEPMVLTTEDALTSLVFGDVDVLYAGGQRVTTELAGSEALAALLSAGIVPELVPAATLRFGQAGVTSLSSGFQSSAFSVQSLECLFPYDPRSSHNQVLESDLLAATTARLVRWRSGGG